MMGVRNFVCQTEGCESLACWWVKLEYSKHVCGDCRDELVAVYNWELLDW